ncbi:MAG: hypothetical protein JO296_08010 [Pseudonocardiales bacterium]|nr:hypothetical protein [Pseudonocardiales bacterium]
MNTDRQKPLSPGTSRAWMQRWLETCDVRDEHRRTAHLTLHQWRHTFRHKVS